MTTTLLTLLGLLTSPEVQKALDTYDYGDYAGACQQLEALRASPNTPETERPVVLRALGACHHIQGETVPAKEAWQAWLKLEPAAELDPVAYPPEMVAFFRDLRAQVVAPPPSAPPTEAPAAVVSAAPPPPRREKSALVAALPFGAGQFQNGQDSKGWTLAIADTAALGLGAFFLYRTESLKTSGSVFSGGSFANASDRDAAEQSRLFSMIGFGTFAALWAYGAWSGLSNMESTP